MEMINNSEGILTIIAAMKETATIVQDRIADSEDGQIKLSATEAQSIASTLRISANLSAGLLEENNRIMTMIQSALDRTKKD